MTDLVPAPDIEEIVGASRHATDHLGRAVSVQRTVYVLHSAECRQLHDVGDRDLRNCPFSIALDHGIVDEDWHGHQDQVVGLSIETGLLTPIPLLDSTQSCEWFARCDRTATRLVDHPVLGKVPACERCAERASE